MNHLLYVARVNQARACRIKKDKKTTAPKKTRALTFKKLLNL